jgi:hypothetical protein
MKHYKFVVDRRPLSFPYCDLPRHELLCLVGLVATSSCRQCFSLLETRDEKVGTRCARENSPDLLRIFFYRFDRECEGKYDDHAGSCSTPQTTVLSEK